MESQLLLELCRQIRELLPRETYALRDIQHQDEEYEDVILALKRINKTKQHEHHEKVVTLEQHDRCFTQTKQEIRMYEESNELQSVLENARFFLDDEIAEIKAFIAHHTKLNELLSPFSEKLSILETRKQYYEKAILLDKESHKLKRITQSITDEAFEALQDFQCFVRDLPIEFAYLRSVGEERIKDIQNAMQTLTIQNLENSLIEAGWPISTVNRELTNSYLGSKIKKAFEHALSIQFTDKWTEKSDLKSYQSVLAMNCLLEPVLSRFHYHFVQFDSVVNRLCRPEWCFKYVLEQIEQHQIFLNDIIQPALDSYAQLIPCSDARMLFVRDLVTACRVKLEGDVASLITGDSAVFCHTVDEIMMFEKSLDVNYGYGKWSCLDRSYFTYCTDAFTDSSQALLTWTKLDREFAIKALTEINDNTCQLTGGEDPNFEVSVRWLAGGFFFAEDFLSAGEDSICGDFVPSLASRLMLLLEFLCRRIVHMKNEELRYLYVSQVHYGLLDKFHKMCMSDCNALELGKYYKNGKHLDSTWGSWCGIMRGVTFIIQNLTQWEQSVMFIELTRSLANSKISRTHIMKKYLESSRTALSMAARVASETVMSRDEATAVREAIVGPGAMIGPTAALSAAYSMGFETVRTLFGTSPERKELKRIEDIPVDPALPISPTVKAQHHQVEKMNLLGDTDEDDVFAQSIFERYISCFEKFIQDSIESAVSEVAKILQNDLSKYQLSSFWTNPIPSTQSVSSELTASLSLCKVLLSISKQHLPFELCERFSKSLVTIVDNNLVRCVFDVCQNFIRLAAQKRPVSPSACNEKAPKSKPCAGVISKESAKQFELDVDVWLSVWATAIPNPVRVFRRTCAVRQILLMDRYKLKDIGSILGTEVGTSTPIKRGKYIDMKNDEQEMTQITTILEASGISSLTLQEVYLLCQVCI
uniref:Uncharacterized protein AlNc14C44G3624 n=1 Tax=Albugo laibachii Nc14 TaxID=890382 RepID=F0WA95_9STRA|nr:conserved hypothetical protein [Albugo laibachii Nc14]|eukprot:CCA18065.1 conserved hypothetical protein [Albugo laibachii Nc14]